jgi:hypothetical protein
VHHHHHHHHHHIIIIITSSSHHHQDQRNVLRDPPPGSNTFAFDYTEQFPVALALLEEDPRLNDLLMLL